MIFTKWYGAAENKIWYDAVVFFDSLFNRGNFGNICLFYGIITCARLKNQITSICGV
jgi:hypothetical protein